MKDTLVGTWRLLSATETTEKGEQSDLFGRNPTGFLTYTADGRMMGIISHAGRKPLSVPDHISAAPAEERAEAFATFVAYAGTYTQETDRVIHHVQAAWLENWVGTDQVRIIAKLQADQLILRTRPYLSRGRTVTSELVWQRLKLESEGH